MGHVLSKLLKLSNMNVMKCVLARKKKYEYCYILPNFVVKFYVVKIDFL